MENDFGACSYSVLIEGRPLDHFPFQGVIDLRNQFKGQRLEDGRRWYAMSKQIIELGSNNENLCGCMLVHHIFRDL